MPVKLTSFFQLNQGQRVLGWSESVVLNYDGLAPAAAAIPLQSGYLYLRCQMFGAGVVNTYNRLSLVAAGKVKAGTVRRPYIPLPGLTPGAEDGGLPFYNTALKVNNADYSQTVLMLRMTTQPTAPPQYVRSAWLGGVPDISDTTGSPRPLPGAFTSAYDAWVQACIGRPAANNRTAVPGILMMEVEARDDTNGKFKQCASFDPQTQRFTVPTHGFADKDYVVAIGFRGDPGDVLPRGKYQIVFNDANSFSLSGAEAMHTFKTFGGFRPLYLDYKNVSGIAQRGFTNKKHGRPFGLLRGRRATATRFQA